MNPLSYHLSQTQKFLIAEIEAAFNGVSRENGISWSEADAMDDYASPAQRATARAKDREARWQDLLLNPEWPGSDLAPSWSFLDPVGFRYYLPAVLMQEVRLYPAYLWAGDITEHLVRQPINNLTERQLRVVDRGAQFMIAVARRNKPDDYEPHDWQAVRKNVKSHLRNT